MQTVLTCLREAHDAKLLLLSVIVCTIGVYASFAIGRHSIRQEGRARRVWAAVSVGAAGCTAWATYMILLLAFLPGMLSGFDPFLTALSLFLGVAGIGLGILMTVNRVSRGRRFLAGAVLGVGVTALHYVGQAAYKVVGTSSWDLALVAWSVAASLLLFGGGMVLSGESNRSMRKAAAPLFLLSIGVLHLCGMAALTLTFDPRVPLRGLHRGDGVAG